MPSSPVFLLLTICTHIFSHCSLYSYLHPTLLLMPVSGLMFRNHLSKISSLWLEILNWNQLQFWVLTSVTMMSAICWTVTPCSPSEVQRHCEGTERLNWQGKTVIRKSNKQEPSNSYRLFTRLTLPSLMKEAGCSSEKSVNFYINTLCQVNLLVIVSGREGFYCAVANLANIVKINK
jgi:hypothetical protein